MTRKNYTSATAPQIPLAKAQPGDIVACHSKGFAAEAIRFGEWKAGYHFHDINHVCMIVEVGEDPAHTIVNTAGAHGTERSTLADCAVGGFYYIVPLDAFPTVDGKPVDRERVVAASDALLGHDYGFVTIGSIGISMLLPDPIRFMWKDSLICSAYASLAMHAGGVAVPGDDLYWITPAEVVDLSTTK